MSAGKGTKMDPHNPNKTPNKLRLSVSTTTGIQSPYRSETRKFVEEWGYREYPAFLLGPQLSSQGTEDVVKGEVPILAVP